MRRRAPNLSVPLFPFLSVLLSTMGVLAFLSISFLVISRFTPHEIVQQRQIEFEWIGAPEYVEPIYIKCLGNYIEYYNLFSNREERIALEDLLKEVKGENPVFISYLLKIDRLNKEMKRSFRQTEHFPLLLVYPDGVLASEVITSIWSPLLRILLNGTSFPLILAPLVLNSKIICLICLLHLLIQQHLN